MPARLIDGKAIAEKIRQGLAEEIERLRADGITPGLAAVLIGDDPASQIYVRNKARACKKTGVYSEVITHPATFTDTELARLVEELNQRSDIHGILIQSPLPKHMNEAAMVLKIDPAKDVDGFHPYNLGKLLMGKPDFLPCTPFGIVRMLEEVGVDPKGKKVVILGRGNIVGKPLAAMLMQKWPGCNATVTVCHTGTADIAGETRRADIIVAAMGRPRFVTADMIKEGAILIDVGINRVEDSTREKGYYVCGDVDFDGCLDKAGMITPVPGSVGPMTIAMLIHNTVKAARSISLKDSKI